MCYLSQEIQGNWIYFMQEVAMLNYLAFLHSFPKLLMTHVFFMH